MRSKDRNHRIGGDNWHNKLRSSKHFFAGVGQKKHVENNGSPWISWCEWKQKDICHVYPCFILFFILSVAHVVHYVHRVFTSCDMVFIMFITCSFFLTWVSSLFIMCHGFLTWFSSCVFVCSLLFYLHGFHHFASCAGRVSTQNVTFVYVCFKKTSAPDKQETAFTFTRILSTPRFLALICFSVCWPKVLPNFPIPTTVLTAKETAYLALVDVKTLPIKMAKIHHRKHLLAESDCLRACIFLDQHVIWDENKAASKSRQLAIPGSISSHPSKNSLATLKPC